LVKMPEAAMPLYIRDDEVWAMAQRLAAIRGTTVTDAVRRALARALEEADREREHREQALRRLFAEFDASPAARPFGDDEMYDEHGLPR
jgi:antitoxin VapB